MRRYRNCLICKGEQESGGLHADNYRAGKEAHTVLTIMKIAVIGVAGAILAVQLKECKAGYAVYLSLGTGLLICAWTLAKLDTVVEMLEKLQQLLHINTAYIGAFLKMIGITYLSDFAAGLCKDAGNSVVAHQIELFGKVSILAVSMPVLSALIETIEAML